jgi:hypothetical protein
MRNAHNIFVGKSEILRRRWENNIKETLKKHGVRAWPGFM